jgi:Ulp1 family protease
MIFIFYLIQKGIKSCAFKLKDMGSIYIPINVKDLHWFLIIVTPIHLKIEIYDSIIRKKEIDDYYKPFVNVILEWIDSHLGLSGEESKWNICISNKVLIQPSEDLSCGIFVCLHVCMHWRNIQFPINSKIITVEWLKLLRKRFFLMFIQADITKGNCNGPFAEFNYITRYVCFKCFI